MKQYDIVPLGRSRNTKELAVVLQHDGLYLLRTLIVAPLSKTSEFKNDLPKINPIVEHDGNRWYVIMQDMAAVSRDILGDAVGNVEASHFEIVDALDRLFTGH